jgi:hypothetical protein
MKKIDKDRLEILNVLNDRVCIQCGSTIELGQISQVYDNPPSILSFKDEDVFCFQCIIGLAAKPYSVSPIHRYIIKYVNLDLVEFRHQTYDEEVMYNWQRIKV